MVRAAVALAAMLLIAGPHSAFAGAPSSACANPDVLDWLRQRFRAQTPYAALDPRTVNEAPSARGDVVHCGVCLRLFTYDPSRAGMAQVSPCQAHQYAVRPRPNGFVVLSVD